MADPKGSKKASRRCGHLHRRLACEDERRLVSKPVERSTYVLFASAALVLLFWQWRPLPHVVWEIRSPIASAALQAAFWLGWGLVLVSTFLISHFELFGLRQAVIAWFRREPEVPVFRTPLLYKQVRHPIYLGFLLAFWATPVMTAGHLLFALGTTAYILIGIRLRERDLAALFGERYRAYKRKVHALLPLPAGTLVRNAAGASTDATARRT